MIYIANVLYQYDERKRIESCEIRDRKVVKFCLSVRNAMLHFDAIEIAKKWHFFNDILYLTYTVCI